MTKNEALMSIVEEYAPVCSCGNFATCTVRAVRSPATYPGLRSCDNERCMRITIEAETTGRASSRVVVKDLPAASALRALNALR